MPRFHLLEDEFVSLLVPLLLPLELVPGLELLLPWSEDPPWLRWLVPELEELGVLLGAELLLLLPDWSLVPPVPPG